MDIEAESGRLEQQSSDLLVVGHFEGDRAVTGVAAGIDRRLDGAIQQLLEIGDVTGKRDELTVIHTFGRLPAPRVAVVGLGKRTSLSSGSLRDTVAGAARSFRRRGIQRVALDAIAAADLGAAAAAEAIAEGFGLGLYRFRRHKTAQLDDKDLRNVSIVAQNESDTAQIRSGIERGRILAEAANFARDLANEPSNYMTPTELASRAREAADETGLECQVLDREDMVELGMGALLGVAKGSHEEPTFIVLTYRGDPQTDSSIGLIGKGVTFDTGGISIKPAPGMEEMKGDMSGGAAVIAALRAIAKLKPAVNVTGIVPATENMPGGAAIKPGDVLVAMNGKTIEVINTDAEGRLILADGISYARKLDLSPIIDVATLTGAITVTLGDVAAGVFSNDEQLVHDLRQAGEQAGEKLWQLPLFDEYREQLKSEIADLKNVGGRKAGSITAAWFLAEFVDSTPWAHLDIAGVDTYEHERGWIVKGASGIPVRTLVHFVLNRAQATARSGREPAVAPAGA